MNNRLFIVSGPSGAGKSSLCQALLTRCPSLQLSISCTTRKPRPGETEGESYHFLTSNSFDSLVESGAFLEWAKVHDHCYGTRIGDVEASLRSGHDVLLEIDWQGAAQVAKKMPKATRIFILPPSLDELRRRLLTRKQDHPDVIARRVQAASDEMSHRNEAHHVITNDDFDQALLALQSIIED